MKRKILVIEDDTTINEGGCAFLTAASYQVFSALSAEEGLELIERISCDLVILNIMLPGMSGLEVLSRMKEQSDTAVIIVTAFDDESTQVASFQALCDDYISKPFSFMPYTIGLSVLASILVSYFYSKKLTRPIIAIDKTLQQMLLMSQDAKVLVAQDNEIGTLSKSINDLYATLLQNIYDYRSSNAYIRKMESERLDLLQRTSHELKTPLAKLSILLENMLLKVGKYQDRDHYLAEAYTITQDLSDMLKDILSNLKTQSVLQKHVDTIFVDEVLEEKLAYYAISMKANDLQVDTLLERTSILMDKDNLHFLLSNILSNIAKHAKEHSKIFVRLQDVVLSFANVVKEEDLEDLEELSVSFSSGQYFSRVSFGLELIRRISQRYQIVSRYEIEEEMIKTYLDFHVVKAKDSE